MFNDVDSEMQEAIEDVKFGVKSIAILQHATKKLLDIITLEDLQFTATVSERGYQARLPK